MSSVVPTPSENLRLRLKGIRFYHPLKSVILIELSSVSINLSVLSQPYG